MNLRTAVLAWLFLGLIGSLAATVAVRATARGEYPTAVAAIGGCAFCYGLIAPLMKIVRGWHQVAVIADRAPGQHQSTPGAIVFVLSDGNFALLSTQAMTPNGSALRELIRFYWTHPESRDELTDGRARARLTQMQL